LDRDQPAAAQDGRVRKTVPYLAAWFLAGAVAVGVASAGVSIVGEQVTDSRQAPLSAEQVRELAADAGATTTTTEPAAVTTTTVPSPVARPDDRGGDDGGAPPPIVGGTTSTTAATVAPPVSASTKTYNLVGGTVTLRFSPAGVTVLAAVPNAGFSVDISETHGTGARVELEREDHGSRVDAWWDAGPQDEVREDS
jgi:hypothetical protein